MATNYSLLSKAYNTAFDLSVSKPADKPKSIWTINLSIIATHLSFIPIGVGGI